MTTDAATRWDLMLAQLEGQTLPEPPPLPGRVVMAPPPPTVEQDAQQRDAEMQAAAAWRELAGDTEGGDHD